MQTNTEELRGYLLNFDFRGLMVEGLGWDHHYGDAATVTVEGIEYSLNPVAQKRGFVIYECGPDTEGEIPAYPLRRRIENQVSKQAFEHLIIFVDAERSRQVWQWVRRESGKPDAYREQAFHLGQTGTRLLQRIQGAEFSFDEEDSLGVTDVVSRVRQAMDVEQVSKKFYERFRKELSAFQNFIEGIAQQGDREWYASLMLNRMMFVYFIQKQGFLNDEADYLRNRLNKMRKDSGGDRFQRFYRIFLLRLFHEGLGQPESQRSKDLVDLLGQVPFLNGGLFDVHELEQDNPDINIPDEAFEKVFDFFDGYEWHLDERPARDDNEINPDVLGYIFEKYINQKQMGAYYTKEDITGYITRNTVIPFLFSAAQEECPVAFRADGGVWRLLSDDPDRYIYPAVGHGMSYNYSIDTDPVPLEQPLELPADIAIGMADVSKRGGWDSEAPAEYGLPAETWWEVVARRQRYSELRSRIESGEIQDIDELITLNLDVQRFALDVIAQSEGPELLRAFWYSMNQVSVLDPTCGSGAFLFAALNVLEPLYTVCLDGMLGFLGDVETSRRPRHPDTMDDFRKVLSQVESHPNQRYFILKSIVLNNIYGVDIMEEAVEICKLRLFLKLVAQLEHYHQIEPLPDIDFNIRAGNTLVGFTSLDDVISAMTVTPSGQHRALFDEDRAALARIGAEAERANRAFDQFRAQQTDNSSGTTDADKIDLRRRLDGLRNELDSYIATQYGVELDDSVAYGAWRINHQPFHWFVEFYGIMNEGGFNVVIGNPPYVSRQSAFKTYTTKGFETANCPDIYSQVVERGVALCRADGRLSMIVPLSLAFNSKFRSLRTLLYRECSLNWFSSFGRIPAALFSFDTRVRNTIFMGCKSSHAPKNNYTTRLHRWFERQRPALFECLSYSPFTPAAFRGLVPKFDGARLIQCFESLLSQGDYRLENELSRDRNSHPLHFRQTAYNWLTFCIDRPPSFGANGDSIPPSGFGTVRFTNDDTRALAMLLGNSKLMFLWWMGMGDDFHLTQDNFNSAPLGPRQLSEKQREVLLGSLPDLESAMSNNVVFKRNAGKNIGNVNLTKCRHITDQVDRTWLEAVGFSDLWEDIERELSLVVKTSYEDK